MDINLVKKRRESFTFRRPNPDDGSDVWQLIRSCKPLDENSLYCNLIQCDHFGDTCVAAECSASGMLMGWTSAYVLPEDTETLFVWQVAVNPAAQGNGLGKRMLRHLLSRDACDEIRTLKTTITADNDASWSLFRSLARSYDADLSHEPHYRRDTHFDGEHATEHMVTIRFREAMRAAA